MKEPERVEVCVIGGGPSGMMAAGRAAECGARVILLEQNRDLGRKLLISGGGRCNVTNAEFRRHALVEKYGERSDQLHSLFARFGPAEMIRFLAERGLGTVVEEDNRVFPETHRAASVLEVLVGYMQSGGVEVRLGEQVRGLAADGALRRVTEVRTKSSTLYPDRVVLASGGLSRPETGSTGDGLRWLAAIGHTVRYPEPSLVPVRVAEDWVRRLQGLSFQDVRLSALPAGSAAEGAERRHKGASERGKLLFTHFGLSGPLVLNLSTKLLDLSREAGDASDRLRLTIDLFPTQDHGALDAQIRDGILEAPNKKIRNSLPASLPSRLVPLLLELCAIDPELPAHSLRKESRKAIVALAKAIPLTFVGLLGTDKAVVTSGGVSLDEVDFRTMRSRLYDNLAITGDLLDFERRSGGYSLQICWSSGWVAGSTE